MEVLVRRVYKSEIIVISLVVFLVSPMDYGSISTILAFGECKNRTCTEILIVNDMIVEMTESFLVILERTPGLDSRITLNPINGAVEIIDDGMYIISFV